MAVIRVQGTKSLTQYGNSIISTPNGRITLNSTNTFASGNLTVNNTGTILGNIDVRGTWTTVIIKPNDDNVNNPFGYAYDPGDIYGTPEQRRAGAVYIGGGVGIEKDLNVGGYIYGRISQATTSQQLFVTATNIDSNFYPVFSDALNNSGYLWGDNTGVANGLTYNPFRGKLTTDRLRVASTESSVSPVTGAFTVSGGVGISGEVYIDDNLNVNGDILPLTTTTYSIGNSTATWLEAYLDNIYTKVIASTEGPIQIKPEGQLTEIYGDIRVRGTNPIGTYPVVTNTLYVTVDGNDTNDGRALDPSRACRTISGAIKSPYYQPGTQILVSAGRYLEDNPVRLKPYTSVRGSDIRTTFIEPINKTQDLFHVESGCYLNYMTFLNGRSGLLEGPYATGFNRGAYATAFPPLDGNDRIDLFHSPYIQNCTNQSGPWLKDGTLYQPNQTVQVPLAVGTGTWESNTTTLIITASTGTIKAGMSINSGQQNPGFFNARTLMLANKPFMQEQVVAFVDQTFNSGAFIYDNVKCQRDVGLILDSIATDLLYDSTSESTFAGIQYWNQSGTTNSIIPGELVQTTAAFQYLKTQAMSVATGNTAAVGADFDVFLNILQSGTVGVTDIIVSNGLPSTNASIVDDYNALIDAIPTLTAQTISYINSTYPSFTFDTAKCERDIGYVLKSIAFDLLHGGNKQAVKSGVYYYGYTTTTAIPNEIPQTVAAYSFISSLIGKIVKSEVITKVYQDPVVYSQVFGQGASDEESIELAGKLSLISGIIVNGPGDDIILEPMDLIPTNKPGAIDAYNLIMANKDFIKAEVIAFVNSQFNSFTYSREKCFRDVGILVENIAYDTAFGGNQKSVEAGLAYYKGVISYIAGQEIQTTAAINYLNSLIHLVITNRPCDDLLSGLGEYTQTINTSLQNGEIASPSVNYLAGIITSIINNGPSSAPKIYTSTGPDAAFVSAEILMQANRKFIQEDTINYINKYLTGATFPYSEIKCRRDTGLIIDSIAFDMLYPTTNWSQSTFAGLQYWKQQELTSTLSDEITTTTLAISYLKEIAGKVILNITPADDLIPRYQTIVAQNTTSYQAATSSEVSTINARFNEILEILDGKTTGWTDKFIPNGKPSNFTAVQNATYNLLTNTNYLANEVTAYIDYVTSGTGFVYSTSTCQRDIGYIINAVAFDLLHGGNRQSIQNGLYYYGFSLTTSSVEAQQSQTVAAFNYLSSIAGSVIQNIPIEPKQTKVAQVFTNVTATNAEATTLDTAVGIINSIITGTSAVALPSQTIAFTASTNVNVIEAFDNLYANKQFLVEEVIAFIDQTYNPNAFNYDEGKCYRDIGLLIDAVSQDILLGGNQKSIEAGLAYWSAGYNSIADQVTTTTMAINYVAHLSTMTAANKVVTPQTNTDIIQVINPFFEYGWEYGPQEAIKRNFNIITNILQNGPIYAPPVYAGGGLFALTGLNGSDVIIAPIVTSVTTASTGTYLIGLNTSTIGFGNNATLYFGDTTIYPYTDKEVEELSLEFTGSTSTWDSRKVDPIGSMGGSLVDGAVISDRSPIQSFVYDAFTQVNQGGRGIHITNDGYAQLVSVFTVFCSIGVQTDNGGIASIVNSNANFGDICLLSKGFGKRKITGTIYNPPGKAFDRVTGARDPEFDQYFPDGFWPKGARVEVFVPDIDDRPHISLIMEIEPPEGHLNEQLLPGFLNAAPNKAILNTGTIVITDIDTEGIAIGNELYIRDQNNNRNYVATGTVVTDLGYRSVTLNKALINGGGDPDNDNFFDLYFCGNAYYTVLSSSQAENPKPNGIHLLSTASTGLSYDQVDAHADAIRFLNSMTLKVINNEPITPLNTVTTYTPDLLVSGGGLAEEFINQRFGELLSILTATSVTAAEAVIPERLRNRTGTVPLGAGSAATLITRNIEFLADEVSAYTTSTYASTIFSGLDQQTYDRIVEKCQRDVKVILKRLVYDIESGGRYNSVMSGLSYWSRNGTHYLVQMGENVRRTDLFPDGATVNFYQRSYMSASGYVFEYVGAGVTYGALPQRGQADPVQGKETVQLGGGKVFFTSTDQNGDFRIGPGLVISQATGVLSGRTFTKSLFANMTPFILAIESGGG